MIPNTLGVTDTLAVEALLNQRIVGALVFTEILVLINPHTVALTPLTVGMEMALTVTVVTALQSPEETVATNTLLPNETGINVAGLVVCPLLQAKLVPLVVNKADWGLSPHTV